MFATCDRQRALGFIRRRGQCRATDTPEAPILTQNRGRRDPRSNPDYHPSCEVVPEELGRLAALRGRGPVQSRVHRPPMNLPTGCLRGQIWRLFRRALPKFSRSRRRAVRARGAGRWLACWMRWMKSRNNGRRWWSRGRQAAQLDMRSACSIANEGHRRRHRQTNHPAAWRWVGAGAGASSASGRGIRDQDVLESN